MTKEQASKGFDLIQEIDKVEKELNSWEESCKLIDITTASNTRRYGVNIDWVDFDVVKSIAIGKIKKRLKELNDEFKAL
jgi:hypothetical protein